MKSLVGLCGHFHQAHERTKLLRQGQKPNWALGLGTGVHSPYLWFTPLDHFIPLLETVFRWKTGDRRRNGGDLFSRHHKSLKTRWSWCWETLGLPRYGSLMLIRRCKESSRTKSPRNPREPSSQRCNYHLLAFGRLPQRSFLMPRRPSRRQPLIKYCDYSHLEPRWHSSFAKHRQFKHNSCFMGNKRQSFVNFPHLEKDGCEGSLPLCPPQSLKIPPFLA